MSEALGRRLAKLLRQHGMSQKELAQAAHLTEAAVSRYVSGQREPRAITVANIAKVLGITPQDITGDERDREIDGAIRLIARNAGGLSEEQRAELISALAKR